MSLQHVYIEQAGAARGPLVKAAVISCSSSGANTLVAAVTGSSIRVLKFAMISASAVNGTLKSNTTALTGALPLASGFSGGETQHGHFWTASGEALILSLDQAVAVAGYLTYVEVPV